MKAYKVYVYTFGGSSLIFLKLGGIKLEWRRAKSLTLSLITRPRSSPHFHKMTGDYTWIWQEICFLSVSLV